MIGGSYPLWAETLNAARGPETIHGRTLQGHALRNDAKGHSIYRLCTSVWQLVTMRTSRKWSFPVMPFSKLPDEPRLANLTMEWNVEVALFTLAQ